MRAYQLESYDGPDALRLTDGEPPAPGEGQLLVDVRAIGINFPDLLLTRGQYQLKPPLPYVPGCEVAGTVLSAPTDSEWAVGDRVSAFIWGGGFAERAVVPAANAARIPHDMSFESAAAMIVNYQTALFALDRRAQLTAGETTLVLGAAGGIGTAAVQIAKGLGSRVLAGVSAENRVHTAMEAGADEVTVLKPGFAKGVREILGRGVDLVVDPVGDWLFDEAIRCLEPEGRIAVIGFAAGQIPTVAVNRLLLRNVSVVGAAFGAFLDREPHLIATQARHLTAMARDGVVRPQIDGIHPFDELPAALARLGRGEIRGKAVVTLATKETGAAI